MSFVKRLELAEIDPLSITRACFEFRLTDETVIFHRDIEPSVFVLRATSRNKALFEHFVNGLTWEETGLIDEVVYLRALKARMGKKTPSTRHAVARRYHQIDLLFREISTNGFDRTKGYPISVIVSSNNEVLFCGDGWHRLWICQYLRIPTIPCKIVARHRDSDFVPDDVIMTSSARYLLRKARRKLQR